MELIQESILFFNLFKGTSKSRRKTRIRYPAILDDGNKGSKSYSSNPKILAAS